MLAISIITPVYNNADTLRLCVKSIQGQSFTNWELILVDDGSTDGSVELCQQLVEEDDRIRAFSLSHQGVSIARNYALKKITAPYVCFIDADDTVEPDYLESLYGQREYDMTICGYFVDCLSSSGKIIKQEKHLPDNISVSLHVRRNDLEPLFITGMININCNKLLHTDIIQKNNIEYENIPLDEDYLFMVNYLSHCQTVSTICRPLYHWIRREGKKSGVASRPDNIIGIYNNAHLETESFFKSSQTAARVMYHSYYFLALKYLNEIEDYHDCVRSLDVLMNNPSVRLSFKYHKPSSVGEFIMMNLLRLRLYRLFNFLHHHFSQ